MARSITRALAAALLAGTATAQYPRVKCSFWPDSHSQTIFKPSDLPVNSTRFDNTPWTLGMRINTASSGQISALRFFKSGLEGGSGHSLHLYSWPDMELVASVSDFDDSHCARGSSEWVSVALDEPFHTEANSEYVVAVENVVYYAKSSYYLSTAKISGDLTAMQNGGIFGHAGQGAPSMLTWPMACYHVDVEYRSAQSAPHITCSYWPSDHEGVQTFFTPDDKPHYIDRTDGKALALGMKFTVDTDGDILAIRFFKGSSEGTSGHTGRIYDSHTGELLAATGSPDESSCTGSWKWVSIPLYEPFRARAGVEYVVAIDNVHYYAKSYDFLDHDVSRGEITALGGGTLHGPAGAMPSDTSCGTTTYHVDVEFKPVLAEIQCGGSPADGIQTLFHDGDEKPWFIDRNDHKQLALGVRFQTTTVGDVVGFRWLKGASEGGLGHSGRLYDWATGKLLAKTNKFIDTSCPGPWQWVSVHFSEPYTVQPGVEYVIAVDNVANYVKGYHQLDHGKVSGDLFAVERGAVYYPWTGGMPNFMDCGTSNYFVDALFQGPSQTVTCDSWPQHPVSTLYGGDDTPDEVSLRDGNQKLALGIRFTVNVAGDVTAVRFLKAHGEGGQGHAGKIYDWHTGKLLAGTGIFEDEHCHGGQWVSASLSPPLRLSPGVEYVVVVDGVGSYVKTHDMVAEGWTSGDLNVVPGGTVWGYDNNHCPTECSFGIASYFVDLEYKPVATPRRLTASTSSKVNRIARLREELNKGAAVEATN